MTRAMEAGMESGAETETEAEDRRGEMEYGTRHVNGSDMVT